MRRKLQKLKNEFAPFANLMKEVLDVKVEKVIASCSSVDSPRTPRTSAQ